MEETRELIELRKQVREMLLNANGLTDPSLNKKTDFNVLKKDTYDKLVDLKNQFEAVKENPDKEKTIKQIDELVVSLKKLKTALGNQL